MNILEKIDYLRKQNGWSIYKLAEESGITQSTLANMFTRKSTPSIATLTQICSAFNMTLSEFFQTDNDSLTNEEQILLYKFKKLNNTNKKYIIEFMDIMNKKTQA